MAKISGVAEHPVTGKRDGLRHWRVYWTPYKGSNKIYRWVQANTRLDAYYKRQQLMAEYDGKIKGSALSTDFGMMLTELKKSLDSDKVSVKNKQQHEKIFNRVFGDFKKIYEAKHGVSVTNLFKIDYSYFIEYKDYFMLILKRERGWHNELIRIKSMLNRLRRKKLCSRELVYDCREELPTPPSNTVPYQDTPNSELEKLFSYIKKDRYDYYKPNRYMYFTGRRPRETTLYLKSDIVGGAVDPKELRIRKEITKTKRDGVIYLQGEIKDLIKEAMRNNKAKWLFPNRHGRRCSVDKLYEYLKRTSKEVIGIEITPKYFRKRFHTKKIPISMKDAMSISGLKDVRVAMEHYDYTTPEGQAKILDKAKDR